MACWWLWRWRNERCFNEGPKIPIDQVSFILARVKQIREAFERDPNCAKGHRATRQEVYIRWRYPVMGWVRLNTDGASKGNPGRAGAGG